MKTLRLLLIAVMLLLGAVPAFAQAPVQQSSTLLDTATSIAYINGSTNTWQSVTIPAISGQSIYIKWVQLRVCTNGTGTAQNQQWFYATNIPGAPQYAYSIAASASICQDVHNLSYPSGIKVAASTAATFTSPGAAVNNSYHMQIGYYYAP